MSAHYKNITGYSASDIEKYRKGELSAHEMHELEKAALEDPFLADALEGMELHRSLYEPAVFDKDREDLRARLAARVAERGGKRRILFPRVWVRWAAAVIGLIGLGSIALYSISGHSKMNVDVERITSNTPKPGSAAAKSAPAIPSAGTDSANQPMPAFPLTPTPRHPHGEAHVVTRTEKRTKDKKANIDITTADAKTGYIRPADSISSSAGYTAEAEPKKLKFGLQTPAPVNYLSATRIRTEGKAYPVRKDTVEYAAGLFATAPTHFKLPPAPAFTGKVLDEHDRPLEGAAVFLSGHRDINTTTDRAGQFRLPLQPKDSSQKLLIQYIGYTQTAIDLARIDPDGPNAFGNIIRLQPERPSLDEVTITGFGAKRRETLSTLNSRSEATDSLWTKASPTVGKLAYIHYLQTSARKQPVDSTIKGVEIISFIVNKKGTLSSFKIEQSLSPAHDASTIRLIQGGPAWQLLHGREIRASVRVVY